MSLPLFTVEFTVIKAFPRQPLSHLSSHSPFLSASLHPIGAADPLTFEFVLDVRRDPQLSGVPEAIHPAGEVLCEWGEWITISVSSLM